MNWWVCGLGLEVGGSGCQGGRELGWKISDKKFRARRVIAEARLL